MNLVDTHTHLYSDAFEADRKEVVERALSAGVNRFFLPGIDASYIEKMLKLQSEYPENMFLMSGLHPTSVKENYPEELKAVKKMIQTQKIYAIGEIGIDLFWDKTYLPEQKKAFGEQIQLALEHNLPIVIHCREAFDETFEVLEAHLHPNLRGIFHCFTGNLAQAHRAISLQMKLGIGGVVTFKNGKIDQFLNEIPLEHIVLETDSPYLAPVPYRGKRNESAYIIKVLEKLSDIYQLSETEIARITTQNAQAIFRF